MNIIGLNYLHDNKLILFLEYPPGKRTVVFKDGYSTNYFYGQFPWMYFLVQIELGTFSIYEDQTFLLMANDRLSIGNHFIQGNAKDYNSSNADIAKYHEIFDKIRSPAIYRLCYGTTLSDKSCYNLCAKIIYSFFSIPFTTTGIPAINYVELKDWVNGKPLLNSDQCKPIKYQFIYTSKNYDLNSVIQNLSRLHSIENLLERNKISQ